MGMGPAIRKTVHIPLLTCALFHASAGLAEVNPAFLPNSDTTIVEWRFTDSFERADADALGDDWIDCKSTIPDYFEPLGIRNGGVVIADPFTRPGRYDSTPPTGHPPPDGKIFPGIGCAYLDTGTSTVSVSITWSGHHGVSKEPPISHVEATPLLYINPEHPRFGFGAWTTELFTRPVIFAGYIAAPVENFEVIAAAVLDEHIAGSPRQIELRAQEPGKVTVWLDGEQVPFDSGYGLKPLEVDPELVGSTLHGIALDAHFVDPPSEISRIKGIEDVSIQAL